jgi:hypothetical protein
MRGWAFFYSAAPLAAQSRTFGYDQLRILTLPFPEYSPLSKKRRLFHKVLGFLSTVLFDKNQ